MKKKKRKKEKKKNFIDIFLMIDQKSQQQKSDLFQKIKLKQNQFVYNDVHCINGSKVSVLHHVQYISISYTLALP